MINETKVREFFNEYAAKWDSYSINHKAIRTVFSELDLKEDSTVLDVGCGTGVLVPYYLERNIGHLDAIDISDQMIERCRNKFADPRISFICANVMDHDCADRYDLIMIYNALPHMPDYEALFSHLASMLRKDGQLVIAHGLSLASLSKVHEGVPEDVALPLPDPDTLKKELSENLTVVKCISNDDMFYIITRKQDH